MEERIIGREYNLWLEGKYIGTGTFVDDKNIGESFVKMIVTPEHGIVHHVLQADYWELINIQ
jgi:hypothetical protein